jgi:succinate dehydrogenase hydrophobic anchor subunit
MNLSSLSPTNWALIGAGAVVLVGYSVFILAPAWASYGRVWERIAASFLTVFMLVTLLGVGTGIGFAIVWFYDQYAG